MKIFAFLITSLLISATSFGGPRVGNGGDPRVAEFLLASQEVCKWMGKDAVLRSFEAACFIEWNDLSASVNLKSRKARVYSTPDSVQDSNGVEKDAVTDLATRTVIIGAQLWSHNSLNQKRLTAAMEISLLIGVPNRYEHARRFLKSLEVSEAAPVAGTACGTVLNTMSSLIDSYITSLKLCHSLETAGMTSSDDYVEQVDMAERIENLFSASIEVCQRSCPNSATCRHRPLKGACEARKK